MMMMMMMARSLMVMIVISSAIVAHAAESSESTKLRGSSSSSRRNEERRRNDDSGIKTMEEHHQQQQRRRLRRRRRSLQYEKAFGPHYWWHDEKESNEKDVVGDYVVHVDNGPNLIDLPKHWPTPSPTTPLLTTHGPVEYSTIDTTNRENDIIIVMNSENGNRLSTNNNNLEDYNYYYPIWSDVENGCVYGIPPTVYADFESDIGDNTIHYLFDRKSKCCKAWFNENESSYDECNANEFDMRSYAMEVRQDEIEEEEEEEMNDDDDDNVSSKSKATKGSKDDDDDEEEEEEAEEVDDNEEGNESNNGGEEIIVTIAPTPTLSTIITTEIPTLESTGAEETGDTSSFFPTSSGGGTAVMTEVPTVEGSEASTTTGTGGSSTMDGTTTTTSPTASTSGTASISGSNETPAPSPVVTSSNSITSSASGSPGVTTDTTSTGSTSGPPVVVVVTSTTAMPSPTVEGSIVPTWDTGSGNTATNAPTPSSIEGSTATAAPTITGGGSSSTSTNAPSLAGTLPVGTTLSPSLAGTTTPGGTSAPAGAGSITLLPTLASTTSSSEAGSGSIVSSSLSPAASTESSGETMAPTIAVASDGSSLAPAAPTITGGGSSTSNTNAPSLAGTLSEVGEGTTLSPSLAGSTTSVGTSAGSSPLPTMASTTSSSLEAGSDSVSSNSSSSPASATDSSGETMAPTIAVASDGSSLAPAGRIMNTLVPSTAGSSTSLSSTEVVEAGGTLAPTASTTAAGVDSTSDVEVSVTTAPTVSLVTRSDFFNNDRKGNFIITNTDLKEKLYDNSKVTTLNLNHPSGDVSWEIFHDNKSWEEEVYVLRATTRDVIRGVFANAKGLITYHGKAAMSISVIAGPLGGTLHYSLYSNVHVPIEVLEISIDDNPVMAVTSATPDWEESTLDIPPGDHSVIFTYISNPSSLSVSELEALGNPGMLMIDGLKFFNTVDHRLSLEPTTSPTLNELDAPTLGSTVKLIASNPVVQNYCALSLEEIKDTCGTINTPPTCNDDDGPCPSGTFCWGNVVCDTPVETTSAAQVQITQFASATISEEVEEDELKLSKGDEVLQACPDGLLPVEDLKGCCVPDPSFLGDGACDPNSPYNTAECGYDRGDCCRETCNTDTTYGCKAKEGDEFGPFGFYCLDPQHAYIDERECKTENREWIGDGGCDPEYNTKACGWDGGDCCAETCDTTFAYYECGTEVQPFDCKDPDIISVFGYVP